MRMLQLRQVWVFMNLLHIHKHCKPTCWLCSISAQCQFCTKCLLCRRDCFHLQRLRKNWRLFVQSSLSLRNRLLSLEWSCTVCLETIYLIVYLFFPPLKILLHFQHHCAEDALDQFVIMMASSICSVILDSTSEESLLCHPDFSTEDLIALSKLMKRSLETCCQVILRGASYLSEIFFESVR